MRPSPGTASARRTIRRRARHGLRFRRRRVAAVVLTAALVASGVVAVGIPSAGAVEHPVTGGTITWGFKESFRNYVPAAGQSAIDGATQLPSGLFEFPASGGTYDPDTKELTIQGSGAAVFNYQAHIFVITLREPRIVISPASSVVNVELTVQIVDATTGAVQTTTTSRVDLATLDISGGTRAITDGGYTWSGIPAQLTAVGADAFTAHFPDGSSTRFYNAGDPLDPVSFAVTGGWPAELTESWDAPGSSRLIITANSPTAGLINGMVTDYSRNIVYAAAADKLLHVLDGETGTALRAPIALPVTPMPNFPLLIDEATGDVKYVGSTNETDLGLDLPGSASLYALVTIRKTAEGYGTPTALAWRNAFTATNLPVLNQATGDVYIAGGATSSNSTTGAGGTPNQVKGGRILRIPDTDTTELILPDVVFDDVTGITPTNRTAEQRTLALDQSAGRLYIGTRSQTDSNWNHIKVVDITNGFTLVSTTPVAELLPLGGAMTVDQATGRLYLRDDNALVSGGVYQIHAYDGRAAGTAPLTRLASLSPESSQPMHIPPGQSLLWAANAAGGASSVALYGTAPSFTLLGVTTGFANTAIPASVTTGVSGKAFAGIYLQSGEGVRGVRIVERLLTPSITEQPTSVSADDGETATFTVVGTGTPAPTIKWQTGSPLLGWTDLVDGDGISGSQTATLHVAANEATDGTQYRAVLSNVATDWLGATVPIGSLASQAAALTIGDDPGPGSSSDDMTIGVTVPASGPAGEFVWSIDGDGHVTLSEATNQGDHWRSSGELQPVVVSDTRVGGPVWSISGQVSDFTGGINGKYLGWTPKVTAVGAGAAPGSPVASGFVSGNGLKDASTLASATSGHAGGTATVGADLDLRLPIATPAGTYAATLTLTALT